MSGLYAEAGRVTQVVRHMPMVHRCEYGTVTGPGSPSGDHNAPASEECEPLLGRATTEELLGELEARCLMNRFRAESVVVGQEATHAERLLKYVRAELTEEQLAYRTVDE